LFGLMSLPEKDSAHWLATSSPEKQDVSCVRYCRIVMRGSGEIKKKDIHLWQQFGMFVFTIIVAECSFLGIECPNVEPIETHGSIPQNLDSHCRSRGDTTGLDDTSVLLFGVCIPRIRVVFTFFQ
jgi:hypothetical protein